MRNLLPPAALAFTAAVFAQTAAFEVASVKVSPQVAGRDFRGRIASAPGRLTAHHVSLKDLIVEAYRVAPYQVTAGPRWLDSDEFDIDARAPGPATREQMAEMLRGLLAERFHLSVRREAKQLKGYALVIDQGGPKIHPAKSGEPAPARPGSLAFHGDMKQLAALIGVQLSIPVSTDPSRPSMAAESPVPVSDETGLSGVYDISVNMNADPGGDLSLVWQRLLQEQCGLKLESRRIQAELVVVEKADRVPSGN